MNTNFTPASTIPGWEIAKPEFYGLLEEAIIVIQEAKFGFSPHYDESSILLILSGTCTELVSPMGKSTIPQQRTFQYPVGRREQVTLNGLRLMNEDDPDGPISNRCSYARFLQALIDLGGPEIIPDFDKRRASSFLGLTLRLKRTEFPHPRRADGPKIEIYLPTEIM